MQLLDMAANFTEIKGMLNKKVTYKRSSVEFY